MRSSAPHLSPLRRLSIPNQTTLTTGSEGNAPGRDAIPSPARPRSLRASILLTLTLVLGGLFSAAPSSALDLRLVTDNDWLGRNETQDDLYTFSLQAEVDTGPVTWSLAENAFTDREGGFRFDETYLTVGRLLPQRHLGDWSVWVEAGVAHVGEGLLGEDVQNAVHRAIGDEEVHLDYLDADDLHARVGLEIGRQFWMSRKLSVGPHLEAHSSIGYKSDALVGLRALWLPTQNIEVDITLGPRWTETEFDPLAAHLLEEAFAASIEISLPRGLVVHWTLNRYGTDREHVSLGYRFGVGESPRRRGPWRETSRPD